jgi:hypothetical protein
MASRCRLFCNETNLNCTQNFVGVQKAKAQPVQKRNFSSDLVLGSVELMLA